MIASTQTNHPLASVSAAKSPASLDLACARLKAAGLRITQPRVAILEALLKRTAPASIEQIHNDLADSACDLVTVYRCLAAFQEVGLVRLCYFHNGTSLYQISLDGDNAPYHIVSKNTDEVSELDPESSSELRAVVRRIEDTLRARGYTDVSHLVEFFAQKPAALSRDSDPLAAASQRSQAPVISE